MNAKKTALDVYLARTAAIHAKLERLQQLADDHFGHDPDAIHWGRARPDPELDAAVSACESEWRNVPPPRRTRENSKQAQVLAMLQRPEGATVQQIMVATQWQPHSIRGAISGTFKKKLGHNVLSEKRDDGERTYRIV